MVKTRSPFPSSLGSPPYLKIQQAKKISRWLVPRCGCRNLCLNHFPAQKPHLRLWDTAVLPWSGCRSSWHYLWLRQFILELFFGSLAGCEELQGREKAWSHLKRLKSTPRNAKSPKCRSIALCKQLSFHLVCPHWFAGLIEQQTGQNHPSHYQKLPNKFFSTIILSKSLTDQRI